tara:strand:- start:670 stop:2376 length:1707 start_codon:yes stop_codon:yes gene_type:complete
MNRHERRKQKKNLSSSLQEQNLLIEAINLHTQKKYLAAEKIYKNLFNKNPNNYDVLRHLGILNQDLGKLEKAFGFFTSALKARPNGFEALNNLGTIHTINKNYELALKCFTKSVDIATDYVPSINNLAGLYHKLNRPRLALEYSKKAVSLQSNNPLAINQHAKALIINNDLEEAIEILKKLNLDYPENNDFKINLASAYREFGEFKKSDEIIYNEFNNNFKILPFFIPYVMNSKNKLKDKHIEYYVNQIEDDQVIKDDKVLMCHSLFNYFKNQKNPDKAGKYLVKGNNLQYSLKNFNFENERQYFLKIISLFKKANKFNVKKLTKIGRPIFICGMPRSGTTLCEQILSSHSEIHGAGELSYLAETSGIGKIINPSQKEIDAFEKTLNDPKKLLNARENYLAMLNSHNKDEVKYVSDKMPHNFILIGYIKLILPEAKIIFCKRDPIDNCFSLYSHKFIELSHQYSYDQSMLGRYYKLHENLMKFWKEKFSDDIFELDNEELVNNQEQISRKLVDFCQLNWEDECLNFHLNKRQVRTASIEQVRKPINKKSIGAWRNYEQYLQDLIFNLK